MLRFYLCVAVILAGCANDSSKGVLSIALKPSVRGDVSGAPIEASRQDQYESKPNVSFEQPTPFPENSSPTYPEELLAAQLPPVRLNVRIIVNEEGHVTDVSPLSSVSPDQQLFLASIQAALSSWQFLPLVQIIDGPETSEITINETTTQYHGQAKTLAFHQDYTFVFRQQGGKGAVNTEQH